VTLFSVSRFTWNAYLAGWRRRPWRAAGANRARMPQNDERPSAIRRRHGRGGRPQALSPRGTRDRRDSSCRSSRRRALTQPPRHRWSPHCRPHSECGARCLRRRLGVQVEPTAPPSRDRRPLPVHIRRARLRCAKAAGLTLSPSTGRCTPCEAIGPEGVHGTGRIRATGKSSTASGLRDTGFAARG
jgi:hypothetical protein